MEHSKINILIISILFSIVLFCLLATSAHGQWASTYGGVFYDSVFSIQQTQDGGYIALGETYSFGAGDYDILVMKLDSAGAVTWQKAYGGSSRESAHSIGQTTDGGYILAGGTHSFGTGERDAWILKLDSAGAVTWEKVYGGVDVNSAHSIQQTQDRGYIVAGSTYSWGIFLS
jgi:hypothetical protein